jgi:hypothetical protein
VTAVCNIGSKSAKSGLGQSRHFDREPLTSGLPRLADILRVIRHVSKVPKAEVTGYHFAFSTRYAARPFFPDCQREAQLLPDMTQRGCA